MATFAMTRDGVNTTGTTWPNIKSERLTTPPGSDLRQGQIQGNALLDRMAAAFSILAGDGPLTTATPTIGTTVTMAIPAQVINITGTPITVAAETAKAFGSLGTIPTTTWGLIVVERVANATTSFVSAAANYTTGYASEALALAAVPAKSASKAVVGYITIYAGHASGWVAGTDALEGGTGGNPATTTNYYGVLGVYDTDFWTNYQIGNLAGTELVSTHY
jgi:hypothetical protein